MAFNAADTEESISSTSAAVANAPPFTISACLTPVCRAKGSAQSAVSFHKKVTFKRVASTREFVSPSQPSIQYEGDGVTEDDLSTESFGSIISKTNK